MAGQYAVTIQNLGKTFKFYPRPSDRVKETFHPLRKKYHQKFSAVSDVSFQIEKGDTVGIVGRNGSGKSTLLQLICGILSPSFGTVQVQGRIAALLELGAGFNPEFSGRENVYLNGSILGLTDAEIDDCFDDIIGFADIGDFINQPVRTYSSGMYVRLAFAVAINVQPDILIVDEALSVGDTLFQAKCFAKFREFQKKGVTIIFVTHSMDLILRYCNVVCLLDKGKMIDYGEPQDIIDQYNKLILNYTSASNSDSQTDEENDTGEFQLNPDENRYGDGRAVIYDVGIFTPDGRSVQTLKQLEEYEFHLKIRFKERIEDPIVAFTVKDVHGKDITGTNTLFNHLEIGVVESGEIVVVSFNQKIMLSGGGYLLSCGCAGYENGEYVVYERRYDVLSFEVAARRPCVGVVDPDSKIVISREGNVSSTIRK